MGRRAGPAWCLATPWRADAGRKRDQRSDKSLGKVIPPGIPLPRTTRGVRCTPRRHARRTCLLLEAVGHKPSSRKTSAIHCTVAGRDPKVLRLEAFEPRILLSADPIGLGDARPLSIDLAVASEVVEVGVHPADGIRDSHSPEADTSGDLFVGAIAPLSLLEDEGALGSPVDSPGLDPGLPDGPERAVGGNLGLRA
ncbi:MAG: LEPR-XLL domain-containing protein, partial [Actinomycetota bacterium]